MTRSRVFLQSLNSSLGTIRIRSAVAHGGRRRFMRRNSDRTVRMLVCSLLLPLLLLQSLRSWSGQCDGCICETNECCSAQGLSDCECSHRCQCCDSCPGRPTEVGQFEVDRLRPDDECLTSQPSFLVEDRTTDSRQFTRFRSRVPGQLFSSLRLCACLSRWRL